MLIELSIYRTPNRRRYLDEMSLIEVKVKHPVGGDPLAMVFQQQQERHVLLEKERLDLLDEEERMERRKLEIKQRKIEVDLERKLVKQDFKDIEEEKEILKEEETAVLAAIAHYLSTKTQEQRRQFCKEISEKYDPVWTWKYWEDMFADCRGEEEESIVKIVSMPPQPRKQKTPITYNIPSQSKPKSFFEQLFCTNIPEDQIKAIEAAVFEAPMPPPRHAEHHIKQSKIEVVKAPKIGAPASP